MDWNIEFPMRGRSPKLGDTGAIHPPPSRPRRGRWFCSFGQIKYLRQTKPKPNIMSYNQSVYHIIFRTKCSQHTIRPEYAPRLYAYIWRIIQQKNAVLYRINGMEDHIHIASSLPSSIALSDYVKSQQEHHRKISFREEVYAVFTKMGVELVERFFLD